MKSDDKLFGRWFHQMLDAGCYFAPSVFEAGFVSIVHTDEVIDQTIAAARDAFASLRAAV
jgi:glutamate-1-semialdehyde 2,1-aminomutase